MKFMRIVIGVLLVVALAAGVAGIAYPLPVT
jgi:hypothetical protein